MCKIILGLCPQFCDIIQQLLSSAPPSAFRYAQGSAIDKYINNYTNQSPITKTYINAFQLNQGYLKQILNVPGITEILIYVFEVNGVPGVLYQGFNYNYSDISATSSTQPYVDDNPYYFINATVPAK